MNALAKERVRQVRRLADRIAETVAGVRDIRANDTTQYERARFTRGLGTVFDIRYQIYKKKFFIKFLNNFMAQLGPFFFYSIGGYLVITGGLTFGALVAVVGAHKELYSPWKELLNHYQLTWDSQIKFDQVVAQFDPMGIRDEALQSADPTGELPLRTAPRRQPHARLGRRPAAAGQRQLCARAALAGGHSRPGRQRQGRADAGPRRPARPRCGTRADQRTRAAQAARSDHRAAHHLCRLSGAVFSGTIADNLLFGLRHRPVRPRQLEGAAAEKFERDLLEAQHSGNPPFDSEADWIDYACAGLSGPEEVVPAEVRALTMVRLDRDVYHMGLRGTIDPEAQPEVAAAVLEARRAMRARLEIRASAVWSRRSTLSATTATRRSPRTCCSAPRSTRPSISTISPPIPMSSRSSTAPA